MAELTLISLKIFGLIDYSGFFRRESRFGFPESAEAQIICMALFRNKIAALLMAIWLAAVISFSDAQAKFFEPASDTAIGIYDYFPDVPITDQPAGLSGNGGDAIKINDWKINDWKINDRAKSGVSDDTDLIFDKAYLEGSGNGKYIDINSSGPSKKNYIHSNAINEDDPQPSQMNALERLVFDVIIKYAYETGGDINTTQRLITAWPPSISNEYVIFSDISPSVSPSGAPDFQENNYAPSDSAAAVSTPLGRAMVWIMNTLGSYAPFKVLAIVFTAFSGFSLFTRMLSNRLS